MLQLEIQLQGHPRVAKEITAYFPGKTAKQIRDKRKETSYKQLLQAHLGSVETVSSTQTTVPEEDCEPLDIGMSVSPSALSLKPERIILPEHTLPPLQDRDEQGPRAMIHDVTDWSIRIITQVLDDPPRDDALPPRYKTLYDDLTSILREMRHSREFPSQGTRYRLLDTGVEHITTHHDRHQTPREKGSSRIQKTQT